MIEPGTLIEFTTGLTDPVSVRVLHIDPSGTHAAVIDVDSRKALPVWRRLGDLQQSLAAKEARVLDTDHLRPPLVRDDELSIRDRSFRDRAWASIAPLFEGENKVLMLYVHDRSRLIRLRAQETDVIQKTLYKRVRRYWQGGQTPNTQLPHYRNCGRSANRKAVKKLGRPSLLSREEGHPLGLNVDPNWKLVIVGGAILFHEHKKVTLKDAYLETLARHCNRGYRNVDGVKTPILPPPEEIFTFGQFRYWYFKDLASRSRRREALTRRVGERRFKLRHRELLGCSTKEAFGPGSLFQVDATVAICYLVRRSNRRQIAGRPIIYVIIDVFSRLIVAVVIRLEHESWSGFMLALENATTDKVSFCANYDISITADEWPACCLPERLLGDRGALEGVRADQLANSLNVSIENTPPYRADWKGVVEQFFRLINIKITHWLPGAVIPAPERGDQDYRLCATLDIYQFTRIVLSVVIHYNNHHRMDWYDYDEFLIQDEVPPYPVDLFRWGITNRQGLLRTRDPELVRVSVLPEDTATITESGIRFKGLLYVCDRAKDEDWYLQARNNGRWNVKASYDPRSADFIYLRPDKEEKPIRCTLKDENSAFRHCDWAEVDVYYHQKKIDSQRSVGRELQADATLTSTIQETTRQAKKMTQQCQAGQSKRARLRDIEENRKAEAARIRKDEEGPPLRSDVPKSGEAVVEESVDLKAMSLPEPKNVLSIVHKRMQSHEPHN